MASTISYAPPTAQQKACVPDHKRVARISKDIIRIDIDGEQPIFLTGHGICTAGSEQDINKIIKFRGAPKRKAADGEAAAAEPKRAKETSAGQAAKADSEPGVPAEAPAKASPEVSEQEDIDRAADLMASRQERAQSQYWDDLTAPAKEEEPRSAPRCAGRFSPSPEDFEEVDEDGNRIPYWATDAGHATSDPAVFQEEEQVQAAVKECTAAALAEAIFGEDSEGSWAE